jgi:cellulose synthase operon protein C
MDTLMRVVCGAFRNAGVVAGCLALALQMGLAQNKSASQTPAGTRVLLAEKAHALETRGRPDMAIQIWQQVLLSDPKNTEALAGLAKDLKLTGSSEQSNQALDRLRRINANDPNIARIEAMPSSRVESDQLRQAGGLARQGRLDEAMSIYRQLYGDRPPDGDIALAYYQTLYGTTNGKEPAIAGLRGLAERNPNEARYAIALGTMLTYDAKTRAEGVRILNGHAKDPDAQAAIRQALIWDAANPASAAELRQYLKEHPQDAELSGQLRQDETKLAQMNSGIARTPAERAAFAALNAHKVDAAETEFMAILAKEPSNGRAAAGMGFLRMQQKNFGGAISYLTQAEQNGYKAKSVDDALAASKFWFTMGEASDAFDQNQLDVAAAKYQTALAMRPRSPEALNGLAGTLTREQQFSAAATIYEQLLKIQPSSSQAWRGLFVGYARAGQSQKALDLTVRFPAAVKNSLAKDPEYLRSLASVYQAMNRSADAQRVLTLALSLPFPDEGKGLKEETKLQYAGILMDAKRYDQAAELYRQMVADDSSNLSAWMGLIGARHQLGQDTQAIADLQKMPPASYEAALGDPGFLSLLGAIYQQANEFEIAQGFLERSAKLQAAAGGQPSAALEVQLAGIYLARDNAARAYEIYRQVLATNPDNADAWKGLISTLLATNRNAEAMQEFAAIPAPVRRQLETDIEFAQVEASLYSAQGDNARAMQYMQRVIAHYSQLRTEPPSNIAIQIAWLLLNTGNDRLLYPALMRLGGRGDLTVPQREIVENIWADWSVRRAAMAMDNGDAQRAVDILDAASQAFPDNMSVRKALAGGYVRVGRAKESLALYKTIPLQESADFQGAVGAALAANDKAQAEIWLRQALDRYARDPAILTLAARFEQARGDKQRAADYYRAALAAMPAGSPTDKLAHELAFPEQDTHIHRAVTAGDLERLLNPNNEPFSKTTRLPPLPAYGPDPYSQIPGQQAPQQMQQNPPAQQNLPWLGPSGGNNSQNGPSSLNQNQPSYTGKMHLSPSEENITSIDSAPGGSAAGLRITSQPMDTMAAQVQAQFADQTDAQLSQGSANQIHAIANAPETGSIHSGSSQNGQFNEAQYTPSAQEAASGAYSARQTQQQPPAAKPTAATPVATSGARKTAKKAKKRKPPSTATNAQAMPTPTLGQAPSLQSTQPPEPAPLEAPAETAPGSTSAGASDEDLQNQNLPPLRGPWIRIQREPRAPSPREEAEMQLRSIESSYSAWLGGTGVINYRSGALGYDHLSALEAPFEASMPVGYNARLTIVAKPVFLDSGQADGTSTITVQEQTPSGTQLLSIEQPIGTLTFPSGAAISPPAQQNAVGIGGEVQLAFPHLALAGGYTPAGFLIATFSGRAQWKPGDGPLTFSFVRDSVKDTQLSYSGLRDPAGNTLGNSGQPWGGVMANQGNVQFTHGDADSGFYFGAGGQYLAGYHVETNLRIDGNGGAYWRLKTVPELGNLSIGANFFGMHYAHNEEAFTYGMGGYFSPQAYFLANVPFTWVGHYQTRWHYNVVGSLGVQGFQESLTPLFPFAAQAGTEIALNNAALPAKTSVGPNYDLRSQVAYQIGPHWFAGGFFSANNSRNYNAVSAGFSVHYMFRAQPSTATTPTGIFPADGVRPFTVP